MIPTELRPLLLAQRDLMTRTQAAQAGMTVSALRWALSRTWHVVLPGVIHVHRTPLTVEQRRIAALLLAGPDSALTGMTAAAAYGIGHADDAGLVRVTVPRSRSSRRVQWVQIRRSWVPTPVRHRGPLRLAAPERAVVEAARGAIDQEQADAIVIEAVQRRLVTVELLSSTNEQLGRPGSARATRAIEAAAEGAWSVPELMLARLVEASPRLPQMWCNPTLTAHDGRVLISPDGWFDDVGLAVMVHSHRYHSGVRWADTVERDGELAAHGVTVVPITPLSIARRPREVVERIEQAYARARTVAVRPPVVARRRTDR